VLLAARALAWCVAPTSKSAASPVSQPAGAVKILTLPSCLNAFVAGVIVGFLLLCACGLLYLLALK